MSEEFENAPRTYSGALLAVIAAALICALGGLIWSYVLSGRVSSQKTELDEATQQNKQLAAKLRETDARLNVATEELGKSLGLTQKQMDARAQEIIRREQAVEANTAQLATPEANRAAGQRRFQRCLRREDRCGRRQDRLGQDAKAIWPRQSASCRR